MEKARFVGLFFFLLILLASQGSRVVEARHCESQSHRFKGTCVSHQNCASVCLAEGFTGGKCRGVHRRCYCTKVC
ncbi:hypothetical protein K1719_038407 [Acacia pycnantha]|nr:hypothetical protein K1719_038407 [Acacia pycnantha]